MIDALLLAAASFRFERTVTPGEVGPNRLRPDAVLLAGARPMRCLGGDAALGGLEDLRLFDARGVEVPYLLLAPPVRQEQWRAGVILPVAPTKSTSGLEVDLGLAVDVDRLRLMGLPAPVLKKLRLEGSGDRAHWTLLAAESTVFDLPEQQLRDTDVRFVHGPYRYLRVTWDDRASARLTHVGSVSARLHDPGAAPEPMRVPATVSARAPAEPGRSRYRVQLPGVHLPVAALELSVRNGNVYREATVREVRLTGMDMTPVTLGQARLKRAEKDGTVAEEMVVPITCPDGADLELVVEDESNPPLALDGVSARLIALPAVYFESADGAPLQARYGNPTLAAPRYDLEAARRRAATAPAAGAVWTGAVRGPAAAVAVAGAATPPVGAPLQPERFRRSREVSDLPAGLVSLVLDLDVLARSHDLADVRLADGESRQVPYILERRDEPMSVDLALPTRRADGSSSVYRFSLPQTNLPPGSRLVVTTTAPVFERAVTLRTLGDDTHGREPMNVLSREWRHGDPDSEPPPLVLDLPAVARQVDLVLHEGDNAPLPLTRARLLVPSFALRFYSTGASLTLLYDQRGLSAPRYDLVLLAPRLTAEPAREVVLGPARVAERPEGGTREKAVFWAAIVAALLVLLFLLARLLRAPADPAQ